MRCLRLVSSLSVVLTLVASAGSARAQPRRLPGWPQQLAAGVSGGYVLAPMEGATIVDLDGDNKREIVASSGDQVWVFDADGTVRKGWPQRVQGTAQAPPSVGDIDGDGKPEIVQVARGLRYSDPTSIHVFEADGSAATGWPRVWPNLAFRAVTLADLDGNGAQDLIIQVGIWPPAGTIEVRSGDGRLLGATWRHKLDDLPLAPAAVGDIDGDGKLEVAHATATKLYLRDHTGKLLAGFPLEVQQGHKYDGGLLLANLDGKAGLELVYVTREDVTAGGKAWLHARDPSGAQLAGFPVLIGPDIVNVGQPSAGDIANNGAMVIALPVRDKGVALIGADGKALAASPIGIPNPNASGAKEEINASVQLVDLDGDGDLEIVADRNRWDTKNNNQGWLDAFHHDGKTVTGFPLIVSGSTFFNGPTLGDVDNDGTLEIAVVATINANPPKAFIELWTVPGSKAATVGWTTYAGGARRASCAGCADASKTTFVADGGGLVDAGPEAGSGDASGGGDAGKVDGGDGSSNDDDGGCGCAAGTRGDSAGGAGGAGLLLLALGTLLFTTRRRRRARR